MTFGRPAIVSKGSCGAVPLPIPVDEEYIRSTVTSDVLQPADRPSMLVFFVKSLELYDILNDILLSLYKPSAESLVEDVQDFFHLHQGSSDGERTIFELDRALTRWSRSLPPHLRRSTESPNSGPLEFMFCRQANVLKARFVCRF